MSNQKTVQIKTPDGFTLSGLFENTSAQSQQCVVLLHGLGVDKEELGAYTKLASDIANAGYHTFRFDFRGCGQSSGQDLDFNIQGASTDLQSVITYLQSQGYNQFVFVAASFSGATASFYSEQNPQELKGLILWNALIDYKEKIHPTTERNKKAWGEAALKQIETQGFVQRHNGFKLSKTLIDQVWRLTPWRSLLNYKGPLLFIHGTNDTFVPYSYAVDYVKKIPQATLVTIKGAEHGFHGDNYYQQASQAAAAFIQKIFPKE